MDILGKVGTMGKGKQESEQELKDWTVMVYLAGDNNLSEECVWSLKEMYRTGVNGNIALVVQIDPRASRMRRFEVGTDLEERKKARQPTYPPARSTVEGGWPELAQVPQPREIGDSTDGILFSHGLSVPTATDSRSGGNARRSRKNSDDMSSPEVLRQFIIESKENHRAHHYLLILSGHGSGAIGNSFLVDDFPARGLSMAQLSDALRGAGAGIDVLGMDSCGMGMVEIGYELRDSVKYLVASEGFEQNTGWPYHRVLGVLNENQGIEPSALAAKLVEVHTQYYADYIMAGVSTDMAACNLEKSDELAAAVSRLADALKRNFPKGKRETYEGNHEVYVEDLDLEKRAVADAVILAHWRAQSYRFELHTDLYDFCELLGKGCSGNQEIVEACEYVKAVIKGREMTKVVVSGGELAIHSDGYVIKCCRSGGTFQYSNGVAIYFPWAAFLPGYKRLRFSEETTWDEFLKIYVEKTRRRPRHSSYNYGSVPGTDEQPADLRDVLNLEGRDVLAVGDRDVLTVGDRDVLTVGDRDVLTVGDRDVLTVGDRDVLTDGDREVLTVGDRDVLTVGDRGGSGILPAVKNPPRQFLAKSFCGEAFVVREIESEN